VLDLVHQSVPTGGFTARVGTQGSMKPLGRAVGIVLHYRPVTPPGTVAIVAELSPGGAIRRETYGQAYIEARPKGRLDGARIDDYVVEDHADRVLATFKTQAEALNMENNSWVGATEVEKSQSAR
jgi:hypothetical protein